MIIGKLEKEKHKKIVVENEFLKNQRINLLEELKETRENLNLKDEHIEELLNIIKAIINKFAQSEIIVNKEEMLQAKQCKLIEQRDLLSNSKIYRSVNERAILDSFKEE